MAIQTSLNSGNKSPGRDPKVKIDFAPLTGPVNNLTP